MRDKYHFFPLRDFFSDAFKSGYVVGCSYTVKPDNDRLHAAVEEWVAQGMVTLEAPANFDPSAAKVSGIGTVT
jgi:hypothetical protein